MHSYPLVFTPILKEKVWGGRKLADLGKQLPQGALIGESWELADLPLTVDAGRSVIANGPLANQTLHNAIAADGEAIMGPAPLTPQGGFPLLVKYLDAHENLSVQVHPDHAYVKKHPQAHLKSEAWVVVTAEPTAVIYKGVKRQVTREQFARHIETGQVVNDLNAVAVTSGECHYLPSGTCHALGAGVVVAEIQSPSDTTFRVYDWGRSDRELHIEQALECMAFGEALRGPEPPGRPIVVGAVRSTPLLKTEMFEIERIETQADTSLQIVTSGMPMIWMTLNGGGAIQTPNAPTVGLSAGTTVLMPASLRDSVASLRGATTLLCVTLPSPLEGLIA
ncbi:MAG: class I mannose-6-phosphate isomerase [Planctomycetes bacterium]|nr:class I mannose-6-phosphate isomerase [Planctomycetota bacterium]